MCNSTSRRRLRRSPVLRRLRINRGGCLAKHSTVRSTPSNEASPESLKAAIFGRAFAAGVPKLPGITTASIFQKPPMTRFSRARAGGSSDQTSKLPHSENFSLSGDWNLRVHLSASLLPRRASFFARSALKNVRARRARPCFLARGGVGRALRARRGGDAQIISSPSN